MKYAAYYISILSVVLALALSSTFSSLESAQADSVIATIPVGDFPLYPAYDSANRNIYVPNYEGNTVSVISGQTNRLVGNPIPVGQLPWGIAFDSFNSNLYVTNEGDSTVSVISGQTNTVIGDPIHVKYYISSSSPTGIAFDPDNVNLYVANWADNDVSVISGQTNRLVGNPIPVFQAPVGVAYDSANGNIYVTNYGGNYVSVISGQSNMEITRIRNIGNGHPYGIAYDSANGNIYVTNFAGYSHDSIGNSVSVISGQTNTVIGNPIPVGKDPLGIGFNSINGNLYVTNEGDNTVSAISGQTNTVIGDPIHVGQNPYGVVFDPDNGNVYVTNRGDNTVSVIATTSAPTQPPTQTTITSATDDNGNPIQNGGSTVSTSITFQVTATSGSMPIASFECSLDAGQFSTCVTNTNPAKISYNNLVAGQQHTFKVRAVDTQGNKDPTPATFTWTIITPQQAVRNIINTIDNMHLSHGITTSLEAPLNAAINQLNRNNGAAACNTLDAFLRHVNADEGSGRITSEQATDLRQQATVVQTSLGCLSTSSSSSSNEIALPH